MMVSVIWQKFPLTLVFFCFVPKPKFQKEKVIVGVIAEGFEVITPRPTKERLAEGQPDPIEVRTFADNLDESFFRRPSVRKTERGWLVFCRRKSLAFG